MRSSIIILQGLKNENFKVNAYDNMIFANKANYFVCITNNIDLTNMTATITVKNLLTGIESYAKDICLDFLESKSFLSSCTLVQLINDALIVDSDFNFKILIKNIRNSLHLTQKQFAKQIEIPISTYRKWEQGVSTPSQGIINYIINTFF